MALAVEGPSDGRFFPPLIQRMAEDLIARRGIDTTDVLEPFVSRFPADVATQEERILDLAAQFAGYEALAVHIDADAPSVARAMEERYTPSVGKFMDYNMKMN